MVPFVNNPDLNVSYGGFTTVMKYVNVTSPSYYVSLQKVTFSNVTDPLDSWLIKGSI